MRMKFVFSMIIAAIVIFSPSVFAQSSDAEEHRIMQSIMVNGQVARGVLVVQNGTVQTYSCDSPKQYLTADLSESGWACFEQATGMWLLHAKPPSQTAPAGSQQSPTVIYSEPNTIYVPTYGYGYPYYPYSYFGYPYFWGPGFGLGFGFNFGHGFHVGRGFHDGHGFANGGFNHGGAGFAHLGPGFGHGGGGFVQGGRGFHGGGGFGGHMGGGRR
jgi:hypothetical protein